MKKLLLVVVFMFGCVGFGQGDLGIQNPELPDMQAGETVEDGTTVLDTGGLLSNGTISGGFRYQFANGLLIDGSYTKSIITLAPFDLYSVTAVKGEVYDIGAGEVGLGAMTGAGLSYIDDNGIGIFAEVRAWVVYEYGTPPSLLPELAVAFTIPSSYLFGQ